MIRILTSEEIREADAYTLNEQNISGPELMKRAGTACSDWILEHFNDDEYIIFCGKGNNGGDGLVIAEKLHEAGKKVSVFIISDTGKTTENFNFYLSAIKNKIQVTEVDSLKNFPDLKDIIVIDAIFGTGLNRVPEKFALDTIQYINAHAERVISIDIPSGLFADKIPDDITCIVNATITLTLQAPKFSMLYPAGGIHTGEVIILDINLQNKSGSRNYITELKDVQGILKSRHAFSHKGTFGHALLLAGSKGKAGAAILAAQACMRSGSGLVTIRTPEINLQSIQSAIPEAMCDVDESGTPFLSSVIKNHSFSAIGIGPGLGTSEATANVVKNIIADYKGRLVIDADGLNILSENKTWLSFLTPGAILTPHPGEFKRLVGTYKDPFEITSAQKEFSKKYNCYMILKGKFSALSCPDGSVIFNGTGNPGMATAGSGDVLTGIITALLAQGYTPFESSFAGMYLHGCAGDLASDQLGEDSLIAGDIIRFLPDAFRKIKSITE